MMFRRPPPPPPTYPAPMSEAEVLLEHANVMRKLASDMASQHLTLMLVGDGSPMNNLVRDTVGANRRSIEDAADHLQRLARESRLRPPGLTLWQFVLRVGLAFAVGITIAPFTLMAVFWRSTRSRHVGPSRRSWLGSFRRSARLHRPGSLLRRVPTTRGRTAMGLADRDYMKPASRPTGRVTRLDGSTLDGLQWSRRDHRFVSSPPKTIVRTIMRRAAWSALAIGVFTFAWAIGGSEWAGKGPVFGPPASFPATKGASSNVAR